MEVLTQPLMTVDVMEWSGSESRDAETETKPKRKRQRLDHLSQEEKLMRRKLKNRMAAQSARDRKKVKMQDLEEEVVVLTKQTSALLNQNEALKQRNALLEKQNQELRQRLTALEKRSSDAVAEAPEPWLETIETAELINVPQQKEQVSAPATRKASSTTPFVFLMILQSLMLCSMLSASILKNFLTQPKVMTKAYESLSWMTSNAVSKRHHIWDQLKT